MAKVHFYFSAMNAGKSTSLLQANHNYLESGMATLLFTPIIDNRYQTGYIQSRIGLSQPAVTFDRNFNFYDYVLTCAEIRAVLVDEAQFLTKAQVYQLTQVADCLNIPVIAYGLRTDFKGEPFEGSQYLLCWAEELNEIKTICHCGRKATMNLRLDDMGNKLTEGEQVFIAGNESYLATCREHFDLGCHQSDAHSQREPLKAVKAR